MVAKVGWLKNSIAKPDGLYSPKGEKLKGHNMTQAEMDEWNGVKKKKAAKAQPQPEPVVVEEPVAVEEPVVVQEELEVAPPVEE